VRSWFRVLVAVVIGIVLIVVPLLIVNRAECRQGDGWEDEWSFEVPFQAERRRGCRRPESGARQLLEFLEGEVPRRW
jgi:hypothetical protein